MFVNLVLFYAAKKMCSFADMKMFVLHRPNGSENNNEGFFSFKDMEGCAFGVLPDSALLREGWPMFVPDFAEPCSVSLHLAVRVGRLGRAISPRFAHRYHAEPTLAVVFTAEKLLAEARLSGAPWGAAMGFEGSVAEGAAWPIDVQPLEEHTCELRLNDKIVAEGTTQGWKEHVHSALAHISRFHTLRQGDRLLCGALTAALPVQPGTRIEGWLDGGRVLRLDVK